MQNEPNKQVRLPGLEFYRFDDSGELSLLRLLKFDNSRKAYELLDTKDYKTKVFIPDEELHSKWVQLNPDGIMSFSNCICLDNQGEEVPDVMVRLHKIDKETKVIDPEPYCICRQSVIDIFILLQASKYVAGMTISKDTCPPELDYTSVLAFKKITHNINVAVYKDDKLADILKCFNNKSFNNRLKLIKDRSKMNIEGYQLNLFDLLKENYFMMEFHAAFGVHELLYDGTLDIENLDTNKSVTDYIITNLQEVPTIFYPIPYSKELDLNAIQRKYILVCPSSYHYPDGDIMVLSYDVSKTVSFKDLMNKGMSLEDAKKSILSELGWD